MSIWKSVAKHVAKETGAELGKALATAAVTLAYDYLRKRLGLEPKTPDTNDPPPM